MINTDDRSQLELLHSLADAYRLPGKPREIQVYKHHDYVYCLTVGNRRYVAQIGNDWSPQDIQFKIGLQQYLHDISYPIPAIHTIPEGEALWDVGGVGSILMDYVGLPFDPSRRRQQCDAAAVTLGWFHREGPKAQGLGTCYWEEWDPEFQYSRAFNQNAHDFLAHKPLSDSNRRHVTELINDMAELLRQASSFLISRNWFELPHIPVHGEYTQYHCRYEGDDVAAVIDWDTARLAPRIQDFARAMNVGLGWGVSVPDDDSFKWRATDIPTVADVIHWVECYRGRAPPLTRTELELLPFVCVAMWPQSGGSQVPNTDAEVEDCDRVVKFMRFWIDEARAIQDTLIK